VLDDRLAGYWSDENLYQGAMEAADIAFRGDGTGWTYWSRDGGAYAVMRFGWRTTAGLQLIIDVNELLWGRWDLIGQTVHHDIRGQMKEDEQIVVTYEVTTGHDVFREPATLLILNRPIEIATIGDRFAFKRELTQTDQDPTLSAQNQ
jgi:hypothetical protein